MATNFKRDIQTWPVLPLVCSHPATPASGDPVRYGKLTGVALTAEGAGGNASTETSVFVGAGVFSLSVQGADGAGNSAVAAGDKLYYDDAGTPVINKDVTNGVFFGIALGAVTSGATATIEVLHLPPGA
jgi:predicted RecA/RadA family phage recombinase